jgi:hypothetical protein
MCEKIPLTTSEDNKGLIHNQCTMRLNNEVCQYIKKQRPAFRYFPPTSNPSQTTPNEKRVASPEFQDNFPLVSKIISDSTNFCLSTQ